MLCGATAAGVIAAIGAMSPIVAAGAAATPSSLVEAAAATLPPVFANPLRLVSRDLAMPTGVSTIAKADSRPKQPADLVSLEQKMQTLHINSERAIADMYVSGPHLDHLLGLGRGRRSTQKRSHRHVKLLHASLPQAPQQTIPLLRLDAETSISPKLEAIRGVVLGIPIQAREIGEQHYLRSPLLTQNDGGRPWIYESPAEQAQTRANKQGEGEASLFPQAVSASGEEGGFREIAEELAHARSAVEIGRRTIDGQQTTEFELVLAPSQLLRKRAAGGRSKRTVSSQLLRRRAVGRSKRKPAARRRQKGKQRMPHAKATLDIFLAPDGLPVATRFHIVKGSSALLVATDILATEIPISVTPPPASETITMPELRKLQEKEGGSPFTHLSKREREEARRFGRCMGRHLSKRRKHLNERKFNKIVHECKQIAKRGSK
jgi:hypothetical protein